MSTLQVNTIQTNIPSGVLAVRDSNDALTAIQPGALRGTAAATPPVFQDSAGTEIGTLCRAWVRIAVGGTVPTVAAGFNVSSITYLATGSWRVNFTNPMPDSKFVGFISFDGNYNLTSGITAATTTTANISSKTSSGAGYNPGALFVAFFA